jgi:DNA-directed RNA polymerase subunit E'/Rpb7
MLALVCDGVMQGVVRQDGTGMASFDVTYTAIVCRPYKGEVLDAVVTSVNKVRGGNVQLVLGKCTVRTLVLQYASSMVPECSSSSASSVVVVTYK